MTRLGGWFWLLLAAGTGFAMFMVKYTVQNLEDDLARVRKQTVAEQQEIRVLNAEWSYLTQPERLAELNRQFFNLAPMTIRQLQYRIADLPMRPPPPPPPVSPTPPEDAVAAAEPAAVPEPSPRGPTLNAAPSPAIVHASSAPPPAPRPAAMRQAAEASPAPPPGLPRPIPVRAAPSLDALFAQVAGDR